MSECDTNCSGLCGVAQNVGEQIANCACFIPLLILLFAIFLPWQPAAFLITEFYEYLKKKASIQDRYLDSLRKQQHETKEQGKEVPPEQEIAEDDKFDLKPKITGICERYFAALLVLAFGLEPLVATVLIAWIGAKLVANWQRQQGSGQGWQDQIIRARTFIALITGTASLAIGAFAGWIAREAGSCLWQRLCEAVFQAPAGTGGT